MPTTRATSFDLARLRRGLRPFRLHYAPRMRSTNDRAAELRRRGDLFAPSAVLSSRQIAGRGRDRNTWFSIPGNLTVTFAFAVEQHLSPLQIPLVAGLATRNAAAELTGCAGIQLKWPNDVVYAPPSDPSQTRATASRRPPLLKLAGLLCERIHNADLIGIGLNVNLRPADAPRALRPMLTSLMQIAHHPCDLTESLIVLASHLRQVFSRRSARPFAELLEEYNQHHALLGRHVVVQGHSSEPLVSGICEGVDAIGRLLVRDPRQLHRLVAGTVLVR